MKRNPANSQYNKKSFWTFADQVKRFLRSVISVFQNGAFGIVYAERIRKHNPDSEHHGLIQKRVVKWRDR